jgi:hypothetical protein
MNDACGDAFEKGKRKKENRKIQILKKWNTHNSNADDTLLTSIILFLNTDIY